LSKQFSTIDFDLFYEEIKPKWRNNPFTRSPRMRERVLFWLPKPVWMFGAQLLSVLVGLSLRPR
jgi:hypothetical protein